MRVDDRLQDFKDGMKAMVRILRSTKIISKEQAQRSIAIVEAAK